MLKTKKIVESQPLEDIVCEMCGTEFKGLGSACSQECVDTLIKNYLFYNKNYNNGETNERD